MCALSLLIGTGSTYRFRVGILETSICGTLLTMTYGLFALMPFMFGRMLDRGISVNSTQDIAKWFFRVSDCFIGQTLLGTLVCALFLSGCGGGAIVAGVVIHLVVGILSIFFARHTWSKSNELADATLKFHDFLINYKSTPRSKILRRHLPEL